MSSTPYRLVFIQDNAPNNILTFSSKREAINKADMIIRHLTKESLLANLNEMQSVAKFESDKRSYNTDEALFSNKYTIPDYFINLLLAKYHLKIAPNYSCIKTQNNIEEAFKEEKSE